MDLDTATKEQLEAENLRLRQMMLDEEQRLKALPEYAALTNRLADIRHEQRILSTENAETMKKAKALFLCNRNSYPYWRSRNDTSLSPDIITEIEKLSPLSYLDEKTFIAVVDGLINIELQKEPRYKMNMEKEAALQKEESGIYDKIREYEVNMQEISTQIWQVSLRMNAIKEREKHPKSMAAMNKREEKRELVIAGIEKISNALKAKREATQK